MNVRADINLGDIGPLTEREAEALLWIASGKSSWEAGTIMGVAESTAVAHIKSASAKLEASNRPHLVARAFVAGILRAGTAIAVIVAVFLRLPSDCYQKAVRPKVRRR